MSVSHILGLSFFRAGESIAKAVTITDDLEMGLSHTVTAGTTAGDSTLFPFDPDDTSLLFINTSRSITVLCKAADDSTVATVIVTVDKPFFWYDGSGLELSDIISAPIDHLKFTLGAGSDADVEVRILKGTSPLPPPPPP